MDHWLVNGIADARIPVTDRGLAYGDGLFETIALRRGEPRFFARHCARLSAGARRLGLPAPDEFRLQAEVAEVCAGRTSGTVKIMLTRGTGPRGYAPPATPQPTRIVGCQDAELPPAERYAAGIVVRHCDTPISEHPPTAGLKTLNRLDQVLARAEWTDPRISEGLMSTIDGQIICGTMSNVFVITDGKLLMPELATCGIEGVMKHVVLDVADTLGIDRREYRLTLGALLAADEVFVTNSLIGIWPVRQLDQRQWSPGPLTRRLMGELARRGVDECLVHD